MPLTIRKHTQHRDTFEVGIAWAYPVLRHHKQLLRAYRAFLMLMRYPGRGYVSRRQLVQDYQDVLGLSPDVAYEDIRQLLLWHTVDDMAFQLAKEVQHRRLGKVLERSSIRWIAQQNSIQDRGTATIRREALLSPRALRAALYEVVLHDLCGEDGTATISREGLEMLTCVAPSQQAVVERLLAVHIRPNIAVIDGASDMMAAYLPYGPRRRLVWGADDRVRRAIQIRNTYRPTGTFVVRVARPRQAGAQAPLTSDLPTAEAQRHQLRPERGGRCARQTYPDDGIPVSPGGEGRAARTADLFIGEVEMIVRDFQGERRVGAFVRVLQGSAVSFHGLRRSRACARGLLL